MSPNLILWLGAVLLHWTVAFLVGRDLRDRGVPTRLGAGTVLLYLLLPLLGLLLWIACRRRYPRR